MPYYLPQQQTHCQAHVPAPTLLQIVPTLAGGGLARATLDAAQAVIAAGGSAIVASPGGAMVPDLLRLRATHLELPDSRHPLWARLTLPRKLAASLRDARVSLIQARSPATAWVARALARRLEIKWIATLHAPFIAKGLAGRFVERRQVRADAVIAVSEYVARDALQHFPALEGRLETIPPGINFDRFDPAIVRADRVIRLAGELRVPDGSHLILCPARFDEDRGQKILIEAVKRLGRDDVFCLLLGSTGPPTPFEKELERAIEAAELHGRDADRPLCRRHAGGLHAGRRRGGDRRRPPGFQPRAGRGAGDGPAGGRRGWRRRRRDGARRRDGLAGAEGDPAALAEALQSALSLSIERRAELARAAQEQVRSRYGLAQANRQLIQLYERMSRR